MMEVVDPTASLSRLERSLLRISKQHGLRPFTFAVTAISVALSVAITSLLMLATASDTDEFLIGITMAFAVPSLVAPAAASMLGRLLLALDSATDELHHLARTDSLTGVLNRRAFAGEAEAVVELVGDRRLLVAMVDVDDFKGVNDTHGHAVGDRVLVALAARLADVVGPHGRVGRFGGDEFVVCMAVDAATITGVEAAFVAACELSAVAPGVRASVGIHVADLAESLTTAMAHADRALYGEKRVRGRASTRVADADVNEMSVLPVATLGGVNYDADDTAPTGSATAIRG